jgi:SH3-like domain-containing protein
MLRKPLSLLIAATLAWLLAVSPVQAQNAGNYTVKQDTTLRSAPNDAAKGPALKASTPVTRLNERQGAWMRVRLESGAMGWVHMFDLKAGTSAAAPAASGTGALRALGQVAGSTSSRQTVATSTAGIRGLDANDIAQATPNLAAVQQAENRKASEAQARSFASRAQLKSQTVDPLPVPANAASTNATGG